MTEEQSVSATSRQDDTAAAPRRTGPPKRPIRVGLIGLSASGGWAARAHLPALNAVAGYELTALCASSPESARAAGERYGIRRTFASAKELAACDEVDLVVVAVQAARHREVTVPALEAGKAVYCEWPLATSGEEAAELADLARRYECRTAVGLQARSSPVIRYVRDLVAEGWLGEVLSSTVVASGMAWGAEVDGRTRYVLDRDGGSTMLAIPFGHLIDALTMCLGEFAEVGGVLANRRPRVRDLSSGELIRMTTDDQVAVHGVLHGGVVVSVHVRGGASRGINLYWEIKGSEGDLVITGDHGHLQLAPVTLRGGRGRDRELSPMKVPDHYYRVPEFRDRPGDPAANLAHAYAALLEDIETGSANVPDFAHGVRRHRLIDAIQRAASEHRLVRLEGPA